MNAPQNSVARRSGRFALLIFAALGCGAPATASEVVPGADPILMSALQNAAPAARRRGSVDEAMKAYSFFYSQFSGTGNETKLKAAELATIVSFGGQGAADEAIAAFRFFYNQFSGTGNETKFKAAELAAQVGRAGAGAAADVQRAYTFFYNQFSGTGNETKIKAAELAIAILAGDPDDRGRDERRQQSFQALEARL